MRTATVDGIPVFVTEAPPPLRAGLVFGVGRRDEPYVAGGITHLVEHLAMSAVGRTTYECNASVAVDTTSFTASGSPEEIRDFLARVCTALGDLPLERLAVEADVLRAEAATTAPGVIGALLVELYGLAGPGLAGVREPALRSLSADAVRTWAASWFTRQNAALWLTGPVPEALRLPLADGAPPAREPVWRSGVRTPAWVETSQHLAVAIGAELPPGAAGTAALEILRARLHDELRHRRGLAYGVLTFRVPVDADTGFGVVVTDLLDDDDEEAEEIAAAVAWRELQRLAVDGPTSDELEHERAVLLRALDDPRGELDEVATQATAHVTGSRADGPDARRREVVALTLEQVHAAATGLRDSALLGVPHPPEPAPAGLTPVPGWSQTTVEGRVFLRKRLSDLPRDVSLVVGDDGVSLRRDGGSTTVLWAEAVGLVRRGRGYYRLVGRDGFSVHVSAEDWRQGEQAVALIRARVPAELQVEDDDVPDPGLLLLRAPAHKVTEGLTFGRYGAVVLGNDEWTVVRADDEREAEDVADDLSAVLGRKATGLVLRRSHVDVEYSLMRGGKVVDRHRWGLVEGDAALLAEATSRGEEDVAHLLITEGTPAEVLERAVTVLGLPPEVPRLLLVPGDSVDGRRVEGRGIAAGMRASVQGEFTPPETSASALDRQTALRRTRPAWFRAANAAGVAVYALLVWALVTWREQLDGWRFWVLLVLCGLGLLSALGNVRRPRRAEPQSRAPEADPTPTG